MIFIGFRRIVLQRSISTDVSPGVVLARIVLGIFVLYGVAHSSLPVVRRPKQWFWGSTVETLSGAQREYGHPTNSTSYILRNKAQSTSIEVMPLLRRVPPFPEERGHRWV